MKKVPHMHVEFQGEQEVEAEQPTQTEPTTEAEHAQQVSFLSYQLDDAKIL